MPPAPGAEIQDERPQAAPQRSHRVIDARRDCGLDHARHEAVGLHLAELLDEYLLADLSDADLKLAKATRSLKQMPEDDELPASRQYLERALCARRREFFDRSGGSAHAASLPAGVLHTNLCVVGLTKVAALDCAARRGSALARLERGAVS